MQVSYIDHSNSKQIPIFTIRLAQKAPTYKGYPTEGDAYPASSIQLSSDQGFQQPLPYAAKS